MFTHERLKPKNWRGKAHTHLQVKLDGWRLTLFKGEHVVAFGREVRLDLEHLTRFPRLLEAPAVKTFMQYAPARSSLDCEMWVPGHRASAVPTALRDRSYDLHVSPFAVPWWDGRDLEDVSFDKIMEDFRGLFDFAPYTEYDGADE